MGPLAPTSPKACRKTAEGPAYRSDAERERNCTLKARSGVCDCPNPFTFRDLVEPVVIDRDFFERQWWGDEGES